MNPPRVDRGLRPRLREAAHFLSLASGIAACAWALLALWPAS